MGKQIWKDVLGCSMKQVKIYLQYTPEVNVYERYYFCPCCYVWLLSHVQLFVTLWTM